MRMDVAQLNLDLETTGEIPPTLREDWLWNTDPCEPCEHSILLNQNQLLGLLYCRSLTKHTSAYTHVDPRITISDKPIPSMTYTEVRDTISNIQIEWTSFLHRSKGSKSKLSPVRVLVDACATRMGELFSGIFPLEVLNDVSECEPFQSGAVVSLLGIRRIVNALLCIYRSMDLALRCHAATRLSQSAPVRPHHHEASMDDFYSFHMHFQLPLAAKLNYLHDFPGLYNHVSQPVYFHNPTFERLNRHPITSTTPIHAFPSFCQLHPHIPVKFEEDHINPFTDAGIYWLIVPGRIYLCRHAVVHYSEDAFALLDLLGSDTSK